jgi:hypothetical protein
MLKAAVGAVALALRFPSISALVVATGGTALDVSVMPPIVLVMLPVRVGLVSLAATLRCYRRPDLRLSTLNCPARE